MKLITASIFLLCCSVSTDALSNDERQNPEPKLNCKLGFDALRENVRVIPDIEVMNAGEEFEAYSTGLIIYSLTRDGHYAHPMIFKRELYRDGKAIKLQMSSCGYNTKTNSDRLVKEFEELNRELISSIRGTN
ncbi:hypothetical protein [Hyphococcus sp.]|uniref:hypothetical protein n=1 Tax=Hyphococcus sp. TaxID=2038636 RepID=UPI002082B8EF|nr:MAG: hypothetical protein DHS20C04_23850 [Marinicaulis sp.]